jgi:hypothetical protein
MYYISIILNPFKETKKQFVPRYYFILFTWKHPQKKTNLLNEFINLYTILIVPDMVLKK